MNISLLVIHYFLGMHALFERAKQKALEKAKERERSRTPRLPDEPVVVNVTHAFFLPAMGLQEGVQMKGDKLEGFRRYIQLSDAAYVLRRQGGLGILSSGHRFAWGSPGEEFSGTWGWRTEPLDESLDMIRVVAHLIHAKGMIISSANPRADEIMKEDHIPFKKVAKIPGIFGAEKYAWPALGVCVDDRGERCQVLFFEQWLRFRALIEIREYQRQLLSFTGKNAMVKSYASSEDILLDLIAISDDCQDPEMEFSFKTNQPVSMRRLFLTLKSKKRRIRLANDDDIQENIQCWVHAVLSAWEIVQKLIPSPMIFSTRFENLECNELPRLLRHTIVKMLVQMEDSVG